MDGISCLISQIEPCQYRCICCNYIREYLIRDIIESGEYPEFQQLHNITNICIQHIVPYENNVNIVLRVSIYSKEKIMQPRFQIIVKTSKETSLDLKMSLQEISSFEKEVLFYESVVKKYINICNIYPHYKIDYAWQDTLNKPIIILEDLIKRDYRQMQRQLNEIGLISSVNALAILHAMSLRIMYEDLNLRNDLISVLRSDQGDERDKLIRAQAASEFLNSSLVKNRNYYLRKKIRRKVETLKYLDDCNMRLLVHGCFKRNKIFMKYSNSQDCTYVKMIGFEEIRIDSPVIDFGHILLTNLPRVKNVKYVTKFSNRILNSYMSTLTQAYPRVMSSFVKQEIIDNLLFSYINLGMQQREMLPNKLTILHMLDKMGCME